MPSKGIFTALSGAMAQNQRMESIANNIANVDTPGFKKNKQTFQEYVTSYEKEANFMKTPRIPASIESFYDMNGGDRSYVDPATTYTDFAQGHLKPTGNPFDFGLEGDGFFEVLTPQGVRLTRAGHFSMDGQGRLVTKQGYLVLQDGVPGQDPNERVFQLTNPNVTVSFQGEVYNQGNNLGKLSLVRVNNKAALQKEGHSLFKLRDNLEPEMTVAQKVRVHQGFVEASNVNIVDEMTRMISASRAFESNQKAIQAYDMMDSKLINDVPKLR